MEKTNLMAEKYIIKRGDVNYCVYVLIEDKYTEIYFGRDGYGIMEFQVGFDKESYMDIELYIKTYIDTWIEGIEETISILENYYNGENEDL